MLPPTNKFTFLTQNVEGHERSLDSCQTLINKLKPDFFFRQEDWLFGFEHYKLSNINFSYMGLGKSVDCNEPILNSRTKKAKWGLDVLFNKKLNSSINPIDNISNSRIQVLNFQAEI